MKDILDRKSGSLAYNRLDMQVSQALHLAIELYDDLDYLLILDHYDDIALFDNVALKDTVSFYQMKTTQGAFTLNTIIKKDWIGKLYAHFDETTTIIRELGLITNCPINLYNKSLICADRTPFEDFDNASVSKIRNYISDKFGIPASEVNLSKFAHIKTSLSIERHKDIVEKETADFLGQKFPDIKLETVKTIFKSVVMVLTRLQEYESLSENASISEVEVHKGFTKQTFNKIISAAIKISMPSFADLERYFEDNCEKDELSLAYVRILGDSNSSTPSFQRVFEEISSIVDQLPRNALEKIWDYSERCKTLYQLKNPDSIYLTEKVYINVLVFCLLVNK